jgi:hypothetical protein
LDLSSFAPATGHPACWLLEEDFSTCGARREAPRLETAPRNHGGAGFSPERLDKIMVLIAPIWWPGLLKLLRVDGAELLQPKV